MSTTNHELSLRAAPGYVVGMPREMEDRTPGGILLPAGATIQLPIVRVLHDGGHPHGACESCVETRGSKHKGFWIEEGCEVVVAGVAQMMSFGQDNLVLVPYSAIIARVMWIPKGL